MYKNAPENYICPICVALKGEENDKTLIVQNDIIFKDTIATIFIGSFFVPNNPGHPIIVPNRHYENIYDIPDEEISHIAKLSKLTALALKKTRNCSGVTILQNNEPDGGQHAFHYHLHVFPRFNEDNLHSLLQSTIKSTPIERNVYANQLKPFFK